MAQPTETLSNSAATKSRRKPKGRPDNVVLDTKDSTPASVTEIVTEPIKRSGKVAVTRTKKFKCKAKDCQSEPFRTAWGAKVHYALMHGERRIRKRKPIRKTTYRRKTINKPSARKVYARRDMQLAAVTSGVTLRGDRSQVLQQMWQQRASQERDPKVSAAIIECLVDLVREGAK